MRAEADIQQSKDLFYPIVKQVTTMRGSINDQQLLAIGGGATTRSRPASGTRQSLVALAVPYGSRLLDSSSRPSPGGRVVASLAVNAAIMLIPISRGRYAGGCVRLQGVICNDRLIWPKPNVNNNNNNSASKLRRTFAACFNAKAAQAKLAEELIKDNREMYSASNTPPRMSNQQAASE
jgi:hypothetical protein